MTSDTLAISSPGLVLDGYKILSEHGSGSSGIVYQAENIISRQIVALKILSAQNDLAQKELAALQLFQSIDHPNLIRIHHIGQAGDQVFYTMDWCESSLARRKVSAEELAEIAKKLTGALAELHEHGLIHRNIKPDNILFRNGEAVLGTSDWSPAGKTPPMPVRRDSWRPTWRWAKLSRMNTPTVTR